MTKLRQKFERHMTLHRLSSKNRSIHECCKNHLPPTISNHLTDWRMLKYRIIWTTADWSFNGRAIKMTSKSSVHWICLHFLYT